ncbi:MAG: family 78 glycoside hydrolase catalytic domain, partial [Eubacterium sp.]|nr:family 78 glycoside hydrolase catalytic domain [Eubacterium sp.]
MNKIFNGKWITAHQFISSKHKIKNFYMKVKKSFVINEIPKTYMKITADDYYKLYINGNYVGQGPAPGYDFAYNYNQYDITDFLKIGENVIEAIVYYQGLTNRVWVSGDHKQGLIADIYFDNEFAFGSDENWVYCVDNTFISSETVGYDTAFLENRDLRIKDSEYKNCAVIHTDYTFCDSPFPALQVYSIRTEPTKIENRYFYDFKQEYACCLRIKATSKNAGSKIIIHCGEELDEDNHIRFNLRCNCKYEETCILNQGENTIDQFDYKALRYVEIIAESDVSIDDFELLVRHYPFPEHSFELDTSDKILQQVFNLCKNTIKYGTQEVFVDCPTREKGQYIGDVFISGFAHFILTKDNLPLKKAIENIAQSIKYSGEVLAVSPCSYKQKIADYALLFPLMLWRYYQYTRDKNFLNNMLHTCTYINNYFSKFANSNGLLNKVDEQWNLVDWPDNCRDDYDFDLSEPIKNGCHNVINAFYICSIEAEEQIKSELHLPFISKTSKLKENFNNVFLSKITGLYTDSEKSTHSSIHANMLPLAFNICPDAYKNSIADFLVAKGMRCGTYMSYFYLKALCIAGRKSDAYKAITSTEENSWYNMIKEGATTCFEAWGKDKKWNTSLFHPWACAP